MSRKTALAPQLTASLLFAQAVSRRRARCAAATEFTHDNLCAYLAALLPSEWRVARPQPQQAGISSFPPAHPDPAEHARELAFLATFLAGIPVAEAEDQYHGHCETCAVFLTQGVVAALAAAEPAAPPLALAEVYGALSASLSSQPWEKQVAEVFAAERRAREDVAKDAAARLGRTAAMWAPLLELGGSSGGGGGGGGGGSASGGASGGVGGGSTAGAAAEAASSSAAAAPPVPTAMGTVAASALELLAGSPGFPARLAAAVAAAQAAPSGTAVLPCYILNYIWDGDELGAADLRLPGIETAQYSCHVIGLVLHAPGRALYLCDPNGALVPGGNMEFLAVPFAPRAAKPSTAVSQFDLQQRAGSGREGASGGGGGGGGGGAQRASKKARKS